LIGTNTPCCGKEVSALCKPASGRNLDSSE
jgi:hypothetical protein